MTPLAASTTALDLDETDAGSVRYQGLDGSVIERSDSQFPQPIAGEPAPDAWLEPLQLWFDSELAGA
ncbi:MAG TPA: hypothetical protein VLT33_33890 [Labilithrix sp.]|nr:hypothetical protein [Labilithrix sp.]